MRCGRPDFGQEVANCISTLLEADYDDCRSAGRVPPQDFSTGLHGSTLNKHSIVRRNLTSWPETKKRETLFSKEFRVEERSLAKRVRQT